MVYIMSKSKIRKENSATANEPVIKNNGTFTFRNGDEYNGCFTAYRDTINLAMEGEGVYTTEDGHIYDGIWENNVLKSIKEIQYPDKSIFNGQLENMMIQELGVYKFKEDIEIEGHFQGNKLIGKVVLKDPNGHKWTGERIPNEKHVILGPVNSFWEGVLKQDAGVLGEDDGSEVSLTIYHEDLGELN